MVYVTNDQRIDLIRRLLENRPIGTNKMFDLMTRIVEGNLCFIVTLSKRSGYVEVFGATFADEAKQAAVRQGYSVDDAVFETEWPYTKGRRPIDAINL